MPKQYLALLVLCACSGLGQVSVWSVNQPYYSAPFFAKGQVIRVGLSATKPMREISVPRGERWPESLGGVKVLVTSSDSPARIGSVRRVKLPYLLGGENILFYLVEAQLPFLAFANFRTQNQLPIMLKIQVDGVEVDSRPIIVSRDRISIEGCTRGIGDEVPLPGGVDPCGDVYSEDGNLLQPGQQVVPGAKLHVFAYGLGQTDPPVLDGQAFPEGARLLEACCELWIEFLTNAAPRYAKPSEVVSLGLASAAPVAGSVGRYRIDFEVPQPPEAALVARCEYVSSNATVSIRSTSALSGVRLCIAAADVAAGK